MDQAGVHRRRRDHGSDCVRGHQVGSPKPGSERRIGLPFPRFEVLALRTCSSNGSSDLRRVSVSIR
jgi:hypothetical protein